MRPCLVPWLLAGALAAGAATAHAQDEPAEEDDPVATDDASTEADDDGATPAPPPPPPPRPAETPAPAAHAEATAAGAGENEAASEESTGDLRERSRLKLGPITLSPFTLLRVHANPYVGDEARFQSGDIAEQEGFRLRHARLGVQTDYETTARLRVSVELASSDSGGARIHDAFVGYTPWDYTQLFVGAQVVPFSRYRLIRSGRGALIQSPLGSSAMSPGHQVGVVGRGSFWDGALAYQLGVFNGPQRGNLFYEGYQTNYAPFGNRFEGLMYVARLSSDPLGEMARTSADEEQGPARLGVGANYFFADGGARDVHSFGGDAQFKWAGLHLITEVIWARTVPESVPTAPGALPFEITSLSIVAEAGYMILPRMLGVTTRFEWIDPNTATEDETDAWLLTGGVAFHFVDQILKAQADYTHREERFGLSLPNDTVTIALQGMFDPARPRGREN